MVARPCSTIVGGRACCADGGGGGGGACVTAVPLAFGSQNIQASTVTRYLQPVGDYSSAAAETVEVGYTVQASGTLKRLQIVIDSGAGNGNAVDYTVNVNGLPTALTLSIPSTSAGTFSILADVAIADGDVVSLEVAKALAIGATPMFVQAFVQVENTCGGGGGGGGGGAPARAILPVYDRDKSGSFSPFLSYAVEGASSTPQTLVIQGSNLTGIATLALVDVKVGGSGNPAPTVDTVVVTDTTITVTLDTSATGNDDMWGIILTDGDGNVYGAPSPIHTYVPE